MEDHRKNVLAIEAKFPGEVVGKEVLDSRGKCVGVVRSIQVDLTDGQASLIIYTKKSSIELSLKAIDRIGKTIQLKKALRGREIETDVVKIKEKIKRELKSIFKVSSFFMEDL